MYFNKNNKFFHGIMFHHLHDNKIHLKSQGSINKNDFFKMLNFIGRKNILDAEIFYDKLKKNKLKDREVCLTFDDAIKCQIDIALPVLEDLKIKSFFFVYTSIFEGKPDKLELFRYFRLNYYNEIEEFYNDFYNILNENLENFFKKNKNKIKNIKKKLPFYSIEDIKFRVVRDYFLSKNKYEKIMFLLFEVKKFNYKNFQNKLYFKKDDLQTLNNLGHTIGLHSHNHPTLFENLSYDQQKSEYKKCLSSISNILKKPKNEIKSMSHPCGSYNNNTLQILKELGIDLGFKQIMSIEKEKGMKKINNSFLEVAREDHAKIFKKMKI